MVKEIQGVNRQKVIFKVLFKKSASRFLEKYTI